MLQLLLGTLVVSTFAELTLRKCCMRFLQQHLPESLWAAQLSLSLKLLLKVGVSYTKTFTPSISAPDGKNTFRLTFTDANAAAQSLHFNMISVFQQTYKNRQNGIRLDLANTVNNMGAKFLRMPGG